MSFDYGQRHRAELQAAERVAQQMGVVEHKVVGLNLNGIGGSALTDSSIAVPEGEPTGGYSGHLCAGAQYRVPVPGAGLGRSAAGARHLHRGQCGGLLGVSGPPSRVRRSLRASWPTWRPGRAPRARVPHPCAVAESVQGGRSSTIGLEHGVDYALTVSCYQADDDGRACGRCDSCRLRAEGFAGCRSGRSDPIR